MNGVYNILVEFQNKHTLPNTQCIAQSFCPNQSANVNKAILAASELYRAGLTDDNILAAILMQWPAYYDNLSPYITGLSRTVSRAVQELILIRRYQSTKQFEYVIDDPLLAIPWLADKYMTFKYDKNANSPQWREHYAKHIQSIVNQIYDKYNAERPDMRPALTLMKQQVDNVASGQS